MAKIEKIGNIQIVDNKEDKFFYFPMILWLVPGLGTEEVVSKRWHNLFYILQFCYIFFWLCCFFLMHLATSCYIPIISGYK